MNVLICLVFIWRGRLLGNTTMTIWNLSHIPADNHCLCLCNKVLRLRLKRGNGLACLRIIYKICLIDVNDHNIAFPNIGTFPACPFNKVLLLRLKRFDGLADLRIIWKIRLINVTDQNIAFPSIGLRSLLLSWIEHVQVQNPSAFSQLREREDLVCSSYCNLNVAVRLPWRKGVFTWRHKDPKSKFTRAITILKDKRLSKN